MTDKEIRALIEKRRKDWRYGNSVEAKYKAEECKDILELIDSMQEKPTSEPIDFEQELYKAFGQVKDFTLGMRIAKWFYDMGKNSQYPISEELETEIEKYLNALYRNWTKKDREEDADVEEMCRLTACHFTEWKKQQFEKNRLKHCDSITEEQYNLEQGFVNQHLDKNNRIPTFLDAIEYGMKVQKEQMMANATDVVVHIDAGGYPYIPQMELYDYDKDVPLEKEGDKYKVVLIKEDEL